MVDTSDFVIIKPFEVSDVSLVSSTVPIADPLASGAYNPATTYGVGTVVQVDSPTITFTASGYLFTSAAHGFANGTQVQVSTTGTLPAGMSAGVRYYMVQITLDTFKLSDKRNGTPITTTSAGTGTHTATISTHKLYESLLAGNLGKTPHKNTSGVSPYWLELGETNRWKALDLRTASQATVAGDATYVLQTTGMIDSVYLGNIEAESVTITARETGGGAIVYGPTTYNLRQYVNTAFDYMFSQIDMQSEFVDIDLPPYNSLQITITLAARSGVTRVGTVLVGLSRTFGVTSANASLSLNDYSVKTVDEWGNSTFTERPYSKKGTFNVKLLPTDVDVVARELARYRATPIVYVASTAYDSTIFFGKYNSMSIVIVYSTYALCNIEIEGLT